MTPTDFINLQHYCDSLAVIIEPEQRLPILEKVAALCTQEVLPELARIEDLEEQIERLSDCVF